MFQTIAIVPTSAHTITIRTYISTSFHDVVRKARIAPTASMRSSEPVLRIAADSEGYPVIVLYDSGAIKNHAPKITDTMNPKTKIYFAKLGISPLNLTTHHKDALLLI